MIKIIKKIRGFFRELWVVRVRKSVGVFVEVFLSVLYGEIG